CQQHDTPPYTF
nr:immunoglobulin light chain junction region [Macaca mulatta]MOX07608.1 immunoglobulin light chain junction region [Macaca mulatta]MOX07742.1 immunoglobulin light chain junction region [Macaca mulatta]MOX08619.1 immunoglobulin light chain junction region [Macaca mulatta]MOX09102.1 immunoglobulin light chain junction region [Macaca mulatta]